MHLTFYNNWKLNYHVNIIDFEINGNVYISITLQYYIDTPYIKLKYWKYQLIIKKEEKFVFYATFIADEYKNLQIKKIIQ